MKNTVLIICLFSTIMLPAQNKKITGSKIKKTQIFPTEKFHRVNVSFGGNEGSGGGNINASNLSCLVATIDKTGAGNISLAATDSLIIKKNHGSITYLENPQIVFEEGVESDYVMRQDEQIKAKEELHYIKFTIKNSSSSRQDFYILHTFTSSRIVEQEII